MSSNMRTNDDRSRRDGRSGSSGGFSRRSFLKRAGVTTGAAASASVWMSGISRATPSTTTRTGIVLFNRGGMDALSVCSMPNDAEYIAQRSTIKVEPPLPGARAWLDGTFAMSPGGVDPVGTLDWIEPYIDGHLCFVHGAGMMQQGRSHFTSMLHMEHGVDPGTPFPPEGWGGRHMSLTPPSGSPVRGFSHGNLMPTSLIGAPQTSPIADVANLGFPGPEGPPPAVPTAPFREHTISKSYELTPRVPAMLSAAAAFATLDTLTAVSYPVPGSGLYPDTPFGNALANTAAIIKDPTVHVEMVHIDLGSWDHHIEQDPNNPGGILYDILNDLSTSLGAFYQDLGGPAGVDKYLFLAMTEFGRQIKENEDAGTDHGYGSLMVAMGSGVHPSSGGSGGSVFREFGDLASSYDPINNDALTMTIDYRDVLKEALVNQLSLSSGDFATVFPGFVPRVTPPGIIG